MITVMETIHCHRCGKHCIPQGITTGYGTMPDGKRHCFACCGDIDREEIEKSTRFNLYLSGKKGQHEVTNWPGTLRYAAKVVSRSKSWVYGRTLINVIRFVFCDHVGNQWKGTCWNSDWNQLARCQRA